MANGHFSNCLGDRDCRCETKRYWLVAAITLISFLLEIIGGIISKSLALLSDAVHVGIDLSSIGLALFIEYRVRNGNEKRKTMVRAWGGIVSSILLFAAIPPIFAEAIERLQFHESIYPTEMIIFAIAGLLGNAASLWILHLSEENHMTHVSLSAHIVSDLAQSLGVVLVGFAILWTGWNIIDPISSFLIVLLLLRIFFKTLRRSVRFLKTA